MASFVVLSFLTRASSVTLDVLSAVESSRDLEIMSSKGLCNVCNVVFEESLKKPRRCKDRSKISLNENSGKMRCELTYE